MFSKKTLINKINKHFDFLKSSKSFSEHIGKNIPLLNNNNTLLYPLESFNKDLKIFKKNNKINQWIINKNKIAFFSLNKDFIISEIIGVTVSSDLNLNFTLLKAENKNVKIALFLSTLIKYFKENFYFNAINFDKTINHIIISKIDTHDFNPNKKILTAGPSISLNEIINTNKAVRYGWNEKWSNYIKEFESAFAKFIGIKYAIATSSCTGALQIALLALNIGKDDEVIVPDLTWVSTATSVRDVGARPVFADIELDTWNIDPESIESLITKKTKAIIVVHLYGHPARIDKIIKISKKYNIKIIEDAAPAVGAEWKGKKCGKFGSFSAFSFQGAKLLVTGEGGMLVTNDKKLYQKAYKIWDQGRSSKKQFWIEGKGVKFKISNVQSAIGLAQIHRIEEQISMKRRIFRWYNENLKDLDDIILNKEIKYAKSIYWMTSLRVLNNKKISRDGLMKQLKKRNIDSRRVFPAISQYPIWHKKFSPKKNAKLISDNSLNLPSGVTLTKKQVDYICQSIKDIFNKKNSKMKT